MTTPCRSDALLPAVGQSLRWVRTYYDSVDKGMSHEQATEAAIEHAASFGVKVKTHELHEAREVYRFMGPHAMQIVVESWSEYRVRGSRGKLGFTSDKLPETARVLDELLPERPVSDGSLATLGFRRARKLQQELRRQRKARAKEER